MQSYTVTAVVIKEHALQYITLKTSKDIPQFLTENGGFGKKWTLISPHNYFFPLEE